MSSDPPIPVDIRNSRLLPDLAIVLGLCTLLFGVWTAGAAIASGTLGVWFAWQRRTNQGYALAGFVVAAVATAIHFTIVYFINLENRATVKRIRETNVMRQLALAHENHESSKKSFPTACFWPGPEPPTDPARALGWRVALLPYIEEDNVYRALRRDEPWDSPHNRPFADQVRFYSDTHAYGDPFTRYRVFHGNGALFELHRQVKSTEITDDLANTILLVQADQTVPWPQCNELPFDPAGPLPPLGRPDREYFLAAMADGSVKVVRKGADPNVIRAAITRAGGEPSPDW